MKINRIENIARALKCIAHTDRLRILDLLGRKKTCTVTEIQRIIGLTQSMTSQHLIAMKANGVLASRKKENKMYYSIKNPEVLKVIGCMRRCNGA